MMLSQPVPASKLQCRSTAVASLHVVKASRVRCAVGVEAVCAVHTPAVAGDVQTEGSEHTNAPRCITPLWRQVGGDAFDGLSGFILFSGEFMLLSRRLLGVPLARQSR